MNALLIFLQVGLPLLLISWLAVPPPRSQLALWALVTVTALGLTAVGLTGLWTLPGNHVVLAFDGAHEVMRFLVRNDRFSVPSSEGFGQTD